MIILASASPRRSELLQQIGCKFIVKVSSTAEVNSADLNPYEIAMLNASLKAKEIASTENEMESIIIGADTVVVVSDNIYGKPKNKLEAIEFLKILSGKEHKVITGIAIITQDECIVDYEETIVTFRTLTEDEIIKYVETEEPLDKAGAYGIQGIGAIFVEKICGCYSNVVGLPLSKLYKICQEAGIKLL